MAQQREHWPCWLVIGLMIGILLYFAQPAEPAIWLPVSLVAIGLVAVAGPLSAQTLAAVRGFAEAGGDVLVVMRDEATGKGAAGLLGEGTQVSEAPGGNGGFALIARVELGNPLFAPFAEARFADFTKIHFWKHRTVRPGAADVQVLATFDNGDPFLLERGMGSGRVRVMTSGWQPADSQLALSTKFVPLMEGFLRRPEEIAAGGVEGRVTVGEPIALSPGGAELPAEIAHIAPDPLEDAFDDVAFHAALRRRRTGLKRALLDQTLVSGVGNIYADEGLWRARLHYARPTETMRRPESQRLLDGVRAVMRDALAQGGTSFDALYVNVNGESGYFDRSLDVLWTTRRAVLALRFPDPPRILHEPVVVVVMQGRRVWPRADDRAV